ncbi:MAG: proline dehydrogenase family protein, partial [Chitinophagaceae bacterium]
SHVSLFVGSHNEESCAKVAEYMQTHDMASASDKVWFSQLYGMSDNISFNLANGGYKVAKYLPYGPVKDVVPYLMRRAQENTSIAGQTGRELALIRKERKRRRSA